MNKEELTREMTDIFKEVACWSKLNRIAGFPSDLYDRMMNILKEQKKMDNLYMKDVVILGAGGFAQEVLFTIESVNAVKKEWNCIGFMSEIPTDWGWNYKGLPILSPDQCKSIPYAVMGIGDPGLKKRFAQQYHFHTFPTIIHPTVFFADRVHISDQGVLICAKTILLSSCEVKDFATLNVGIIIGHDAVIKEFATVSPGALIMGNCEVGKSSYIGVGASFREKMKVGEGSVIGANAAVVKNIPEYSMAVGVPAKPIKTL